MRQVKGQITARFARIPSRRLKVGDGFLNRVSQIRILARAPAPLVLSSGALSSRPRTNRPIIDRRF